jgi:hypothetical protein
MMSRLGSTIKVKQSKANERRGKKDERRKTKKKLAHETAFANQCIDKIIEHKS